MIFAGFIAFTSQFNGFYIQDVEVNDLQVLHEEDVFERVNSYLETKKYFIYSNRHKMFFHDNDLLEILVDSFPVEEVQIQKSQSQLEIVIEEAIEYIVIRNGDNWVKKYPSGDESMLNLEEIAAISNIINTGTYINEQVNIHTDVPILEVIFTSEKLDYSREFIENFIRLNKQLITNGFLPIIYLSDSPNSTWLTVRSELGTNILLETATDLDTQLNVLQVVLEEYADRVGGLEYIDVRFSDRAYVK